ncbi:hypothetical protein SAMN05216389_102289 [Oceanobacillus limi]|uniref:Uncharacterized protein n=1 Tax=Oceanobacillus limi TaxID=930131 RepID=A0A1H9ZIA7_9BACI|nr:hypothetical protein SAMN05216389_102289 [Oceanobacillus limi]
MISFRRLVGFHIFYIGRIVTKRINEAVRDLNEKYKM